MSKVQSVVFEKDAGWTLSKAKKWLKANDFKTDVDEKPNTYRFRQFEPSKRYTFRTKNFGNGILAVIGFTKKQKLRK